MKKRPWIVLTLAASLFPMVSCNKQTYTPNSSLDVTKDVTLKVVGDTKTFAALEAVGNDFTAVYPHAHLSYEYVQDYSNLLPTRLASTEDPVDLFVSNNILSTSALVPVTENLLDDSSSLKLSTTFDSLEKNFTFTNTAGTSECHVIPMGGDLRGMFVNKTLLKSLGLSVPKNRADYLACSKVLLAKGYIPMQSNPGTVGQTFIYPYLCNQITGSSDYKATYQRVENRETGISELFREPYQFFYDYVSQGYYNYTAAKTTPWANDFNSQTDNGIGCLFFNIHDDGTGNYKKIDDLGNIAFLPQALSISNTMAKVKDDYHSSIDYEFILSPVGTNGGYAYLSPAKGIGIRKGTSHKDWALEFLNFFFSSAEQTKFSSLNGTVPNSTTWRDYLSKKFSIDANSISDVGQVTFSYSFYYVVISQLVDMAKINAEKYLIDDGNGNKIMKPFSTFMAQLEDAFQNPDH